MQTFIFTGPKGEMATVKAANESEARRLAMVKRWGLPTDIYAPRYNGRGLSLFLPSKEEN